MNLDTYSLPTAEGVYALEKDGKILYVGTASNLHSRLSSGHAVLLKNRPCKIYWHILRGKVRRHKAEIDLIARYSPMLNKLRGCPGVVRGERGSVRLTQQDEPLIEEARKILEQRGLIRRR